VVGYIRTGLAEGARLLTGGEAVGLVEGRGYFVQPTIFDGVAPEMTIAREEIFGPVLAVLTFREVEEAMAIANEYAAVASKYIFETMAIAEPNVLSAAVLPIKPVAPKKTQNILLGLAAGWLVAAGVVIARFIADDRVKTPDDVRKYAGIATLALVPAMEGAGSRKSGRKKANRRVRP
jgi:hypothetical protein